MNEAAKQHYAARRELTPDDPSSSVEVTVVLNVTRERICDLLCCALFGEIVFA